MIRSAKINKNLIGIGLATTGFVRVTVLSIGVRFSPRLSSPRFSSNISLVYLHSNRVLYDILRRYDIKEEDLNIILPVGGIKGTLDLGTGEEFLSKRGAIMS